MDRTTKLKLGFISGGIILFSWLIVNVAVTEHTLAGLDELHGEQMKVETELSKQKLTREKLLLELDQVETVIINLREQRAEIDSRINDLINLNAAGVKISMEQPPEKVAEINNQDEELCYKNTAGEDQNQYVRIASRISNNDIDFLATLNQENGMWTPDRVHGDGHGHGFCGFDDRWWGGIINDERFFDAEWQLNKCYEAYISGTRFYGYDVRYKSISQFTCPNVK